MRYQADTAPGRAFDKATTHVKSWQAGGFPVLDKKDMDALRHDGKKVLLAHSVGWVKFYKCSTLSTLIPKFSVIEDS